MCTRALLFLFAVLVSCTTESLSPTSPAAKSGQSPISECSIPILGIAGKWVQSTNYYGECSTCDKRGEVSVFFLITTDTLMIELTEENYVGEPMVTHYSFSLISSYDPAIHEEISMLKNTAHDSILASIEVPKILRKRTGIIGVYFSSVEGKWMYNSVVTDEQRWNMETREYEEMGERWPIWGLELRLFGDFLLIDMDAEFAEDGFLGSLSHHYRRAPQ